jgi:DNA polymerase-1
MTDSHALAKTKGYVENIFGRKRRMPEAKHIPKDKEHGELTYEQRNTLNLAVNHRVQSTGASIVNRAAIKFYNDCKNLGLDAKLVLQVHDSLIAECNKEDAETVALLLQNAMENTVILPNISLEAVPKIGLTLAEV